MIDRLRKEQCPPRVMARVQSRIALDRPESRSPLPYLAVAAVLSVMLFFAAGISFQSRMETEPVPETSVPVADTDPVTHRAAETTVASLTYMGSVIVDSCQKVEVRLLAEPDGTIPDPYLKFRNYLSRNL